MGKPAAVIKAAKEADDLIRALNTPPGQPPAGTPPGQPPAGEQPPAAQPNSGEPAGEPPAGEQPPTPQAREDWKQKYLVLQGKYDVENARKDGLISSMSERLAALERLLSNVQVPATGAAPAAPAVSQVTDDDVTEYGRNMVDFVQRAAKSAVSPELAQLRQENEDLKSKLGRTADSVEQDARDRMHEQLDTTVPEWRVTNSSPAFVAWLKLPDVFSGRQRHELLLEAYGKNDAARVQRFFQAFKQEDSAIDPTAPMAPNPSRIPAVDPATLVAPGAPRGGGNPGTDAPGGKRVWTQQEIAVFYDKKRRGKIPPDEAARTEREIIEASAQGRVR
jgi:hypothetical protein